MFILHTTFAPEWVFALALLVGYISLVMQAYLRGQKMNAVRWALTMAGTYAVLVFVSAADQKIEKAMKSVDTPLPTTSVWPVVLAGMILVVPPCIYFAKALFTHYEQVRTMGWLVMSSAAFEVFAQTCVYRFNLGGWEEIRGLSQVLFFASTLVFAVLFIVDLRERRRFNKNVGVSDGRYSY